jgi:hypothetical protein
VPFGPAREEGDRPNGFLVQAGARGRVAGRSAYAQDRRSRLGSLAMRSRSGEERFVWLPFVTTTPINRPRWWLKTCPSQALASESPS